MTLRATGTLGAGITCSVATGRALAEAGLHPATGGDGSSLCSGDMLLEALVACAGVTLRAVATSLELDITAGTFRPKETSTSAVRSPSRRRRRSASARSGWASSSRPTRAEEELDTLLRLTERYCVVYQTLANSPDPLGVLDVIPAELGDLHPATA